MEGGDEVRGTEGKRDREEKAGNSREGGEDRMNQRIEVRREE
jgi:hypothetical protein